MFFIALLSITEHSKEQLVHRPDSFRFRSVHNLPKESILETCFLRPFFNRRGRSGCTGVDGNTFGIWGRQRIVQRKSTTVYSSPSEQLF